MPVPSAEELQEFIDDPLAAKLAAIDKVRRRLQRRNRTLLGVLAVIFVPATCVLTLWVGTDGAGANFQFWEGVVAVPAMAVAYAAVYALMRWRYLDEEIPFEYEPDVVAPLIYYLDPRLKYRVNDRFSRREFVDSAIAQTPIDHFESGPYFSGDIRSLQVQLGAVEAKAEGRRGLFKEVTFCFEGLFVVVDYPERFDGFTIAVSTDEEWNPEHSDDDLEGVEVESDSFGKRFDVYASAPEEAKKHLTPAVAERLEGAWEAFGKEGSPPSLIVVLAGHRLFFAHRCPDYFERSDAMAITDTGHLHRIGGQLSAVIDLVEVVERQSQVTPQ